MFFSGRKQESQIGSEEQLMTAWDEIGKNLGIEINKDDLMLDTVLKVLVELSRRGK
jgi:hypothetical protein